MRRAEMLKVCLGNGVILCSNKYSIQGMGAGQKRIEFEMVKCLRYYEIQLHHERIFDNKIFIN